MTSPHVSPLAASFLAVAHRCADAARTAILPHFRSANLDVMTKEDVSPVTRADCEAEAVMRAILAKECPSHGILGEENGQQGNRNAEWLWILDPIDGTRAFVTGRPSFCTLIALCHHGRPVLGLIDQPVTEERWIGLQGEQTRYLAPRMTGTVGTRALAQLSNAELSCTAPEIISPANRKRFTALQKKTRRTSWGGDAYGYGLLALGLIDIIAEDTLKPWDWAALLPVVEGAGGCLSDWNGHPLTLESDGTVLACGNPALHAEAVRVLAL